MKRAAFWLVAAAAAPFVAVVALVVGGFALTLDWLVGSDE